MPCPPPMHSAAIPYFLFCNCNSFANDYVILAPLAPTGCPKAMAPPFTFTLL